MSREYRYAVRVGFGTPTRLRFLGRRAFPSTASFNRRRKPVMVYRKRHDVLEAVEISRSRRFRSLPTGNDTAEGKQAVERAVPTNNSTGFGIILPRTIPRIAACRSNDPRKNFFQYINKSCGRASAAGRLDQMSVLIAFPVYHFPGRWGQSGTSDRPRHKQAVHNGCCPIR